jgi:hypothetical protein
MLKLTLGSVANIAQYLYDDAQSSCHVAQSTGLRCAIGLRVVRNRRAGIRTAEPIDSGKTLGDVTKMA